MILHAPELAALLARTEARFLTFFVLEGVCPGSLTTRVTVQVLLSHQVEVTDSPKTEAILKSGTKRILKVPG